LYTTALWADLGTVQAADTPSKTRFSHAKSLIEKLYFCLTKKSPA